MRALRLGPLALSLLCSCAGARVEPAPGVTVVTVRATVRLTPPSIPRAHGTPDASTPADPAQSATRPARTRCYADDERHPQDVVALTSGRWHTCVLLRDRSVRCWGWNYDGQLGDGTRGDRRAPIVVTGVSDVEEVHAQWDFTCARTTRGTVACWGENEHGQLGLGDRHARAEPTVVTGLGPVRGLALGDTHACALDRAGAVRCWGRNAFGALGDGRTALRDRPTLAGFGRGVTALSAGADGTCALHVGGSLSCAGWLARSPTPTRMDGLPGPVASVALSRSFACALDADGAPRCWGEGFVGQLGGENVAAGEVFVARPLAGLREVTRMGLGPRGGCAVLRDGQLWCWGRVGRAARRGAGPDETIGAPPHRVPSLDGVADVSVGDDFVCAQMRAGGVCCFGAGHMGQLGDNRTEDADETAPVPVRW
jgi:alpha-tubulin suppressor-like RCC1 family protein